MKAVMPPSNEDDLQAIRRDIRVIRNLLAFIALVAVAALTGSFDRFMPILVFMAGAFLWLVGTIMNSFANRSERSRESLYSQVKSRSAGRV